MTMMIVTFYVVLVLAFIGAVWLLSKLVRVPKMIGRERAFRVAVFVLIMLAIDYATDKAAGWLGVSDWVVTAIVVAIGAAYVAGKKSQQKSGLLREGDA